jgi:demethylmenaquinone methyltransferase/2-methoxy-6-polyprenyl-1,4-benzoquinol methylase
MTLPSPAEKAAVVEAMFDRIAPHYDRMNRLLTFGLDQRWRRRTLDRIGIRAGDFVLDVACGTGDFAEMCRARGADVVATDYAARMLTHARGRGLGDVLVRGDALNLPIRSAAFDAVVCGFALRNFTSLAAAIAEMARVLRPGGRVGLLEVDRPGNAAVRAGHSLYFDRVVPIVGSLLADRRAYSYLPESAVYLPAWEEMRALLAAAGFERIERDRAMLGAVQIVTAVRSNVAPDTNGHGRPNGEAKPAAASEPGTGASPEASAGASR